MIYYEKAEFGQISRSLSLHAVPMFIQKTEKPDSNRLSLATIGQTRQAPRSSLKTDVESCAKKQGGIIAAFIHDIAQRVLELQRSVEFDTCKN